MKRKSIEWQFFDSDTEAEWDEQTLASQLTAQDGDSNSQDKSKAARKMRYLYELIGVIALLYGLTVYLLWQQAAQRIAVMENEVMALHSAVSPSLQTMTADDVTPIPANNIAIPFQLETAYLHFEASPETREIVEQIALRVDGKYQQLHRDFGLALPSATEKLKIVVDPPIYIPADSTTVSFYYPVTDEKQLVAVHPQFAAKRYGISEVEALTTELFVRVAMNLIENAVANRQIKSQWQGMTLALETYVQLEYGHNHNWQWEDMFLLQRYNAQSRSLDLVHGMINEPEGQSTDQSQVSPIAFAAANPLVEFIVVTYGDDKMSALLGAFEEYNSWETLTPRCFISRLTNLRSSGTLISAHTTQSQGNW